jgi:hypothetical protein
VGELRARLLYGRAQRQSFEGREDLGQSYQPSKSVSRTTLAIAANEINTARTAPTTTAMSPVSPREINR